MQTQFFELKRENLIILFQVGKPEQKFSVVFDTGSGKAMEGVVGVVGVVDDQFWFSGPTWLSKWSWMDDVDVCLGLSHWFWVLVTGHVILPSSERLASEGNALPVPDHFSYDRFTSLFPRCQSETCLVHNRYNRQVPKCQRMFSFWKKAGRFSLNRDDRAGEAVPC